MGEPIPAFAAGDGYLYLASSSGVQCLDLIAWLQGTSTKKVVLTTEKALSPPAFVDDAAFCVIADTRSRLAGWTGPNASFSIPLPDLISAAPVLPPTIAAGCAFIAQRGGRQVHVLDMQRKDFRANHDVGGSIVFVAPTDQGIALLLEVGDGGKKERKIVLVTPDRVSVVIPVLDRDVTWIAHVCEVDRYAWGDGSRCFIQTPQGTRQLQAQGNVGVVQIHEGRGWALLETPESAIAIDLTNAQVQNIWPLGGSSFSDFVVSGGRVIASNGREVRSVGSS